MEKSEILEYMEIALAEARSCKKDVPVGAVIIQNGAVLSRAHNQKEETNDPLAHAELLAIRAAAQKLERWRLSDCIIFCTLEPCPMCAEAIIQARIKILVYGAKDLIAGAAGSAFDLFSKRKALPVPQCISGIMADECAEELKKFFREKRALEKSESN
ncbi:MAG: nucleoside deaminase [Candidatus Obscuribacterales bacterium]|nr:nucleoside deaminase [Candidatus Obscuribacterales bacterium]